MGFSYVTTGQKHLSWYWGFIKLISHVWNARKSEGVLLQPSRDQIWGPQQAPGYTMSLQATFRADCLSSIVGVSILHFTAWPALLNHQSCAENSEWPSPNSKRRNSVGCSVTLALNWNSYIPQGPFQSLLTNDVAYAKTQLKSFPTNASGRGLLTVWIIGQIKIHCFSHGKRSGYSCLLAIPMGKNSYC